MLKRELATGGVLDYAVIRTGGLQHRVSAGDTIRVPLIRRDVGETFEITDVLAVRAGDDVTLGRPLVENAKVTAEILEHGRSKKVIVYKKKRRKGYQRKKGHRQGYTLLGIRGIEAPSAARSD